MTNRFQKRLRLTPASSVPAEVGKQNDGDTSDILRQECQCDGDNLRMTWNSVPAQHDHQDADGILRQKSECNCGIPRITSWNSWTLLSLILFGLCFCGTSQGAAAFVNPEITAKHHKIPTNVDTKLWYQDEYKDGDDEDDTNKNIGNDSGEDKELWGGDADLEAPSEAIDDLSWKLAKIRLEEENTKRFLKAGPRFLPYEECRKWVTAWNRWETEEDWKTWIREGEKRNAYIPARPDEYYGRLGKWKGWAHFLGREEDEECECGGGGGEDMPVGEGDGASAEEEK